MRQLRRVAVSACRNALRGRFVLVAGQVRDLAWNLSLLARSWNSDGKLRTAARRSRRNAPPLDGGLPVRAFAEEPFHEAARWSAPSRSRKPIMNAESAENAE